MPPFRRGVDADALWTHETVTDVTQHVRTCELRLVGNHHDVCTKLSVKLKNQSQISTVILSVHSV